MNTTKLRGIFLLEVISRNVRNYASEVILNFEDDRNGIPETLREKIFTRGYKGELSNGSGLGLFLVKTRVEQYKGEIQVKDTSLGETNFEVKLVRS